MNISVNWIRQTKLDALWCCLPANTAIHCTALKMERSIQKPLSYTAAAAWLTAALGLAQVIIIAACNGYFGLAKSDHKRGGITFEAAKANNFQEQYDVDSAYI